MVDEIIFANVFHVAGDIAGLHCTWNWKFVGADHFSSTPFVVRVILEMVMVDAILVAVPSRTRKK